MAAPVLTAGVDLAAESKSTALAVIEWSASRSVVRSVEVGASDAAIVDAAAAAASAGGSMGIDCAFGWPDDFVAFVGAHSAGQHVDLSLDDGMAWRRRLAYRETDRDTHRRTGRLPLSVATDRLGLTAMHCAALLDLVGERIGPVDRSGGGPVAEVYPAAALRLWSIAAVGYKKDAASRTALIERLESAAPWLALGASRTVMIRSDDALDAVLAALIARAHALGRTGAVPPKHVEQARREGWIALPTGTLAELTPVGM